MKFYKINCQGLIYIEKVSTLPIWTPSDEGRMLYDEDTNNIYVGDNTSWIISSSLCDWNTILNKPTSLNDINSTEYNKLNNIEANANNYIHPNHTGDVSSIGDGTTIINNHVVTNSKLSNMPANTIKGRESSTGEPQDLNSSTIKSMLELGNMANENYFISIGLPSGGDNGDIWYTVPKINPILGDTGIFGGGYTGSYINNIDYITISTVCDASYFGDLTEVRSFVGATSNSTNNKGVFGGGWSTTYINIIDYITISSIGNASDFGDLTIARYALRSTSNGTNERGIFAGGWTTIAVNVIDYINIAINSNAIDFGDLTLERDLVGATSNSTNDRGVFGGGNTGSLEHNNIDYITISSIGNASDFGDLTVARYASGATSNGTNERGVFGGGYTTTSINVIDYITISTTGNAIDFGDLSIARNDLNSTSNGTNNRGVFAGGWWSGSVYTNIIDYITISTTGDATDFGDLTQAKRGIGACSNS